MFRVDDDVLPHCGEFSLSHTWLIWQLVDSAFPSGSFAHSGGLEAAWQHGHVPGGSGLRGFLRESLWQAAYGSVPLILSAHAQPAQLAEFDALADAFLSNHVTNRASRAQGRALLATSRSVFPAVSSLEDAYTLCLTHKLAQHLAPVFGIVTAGLKLTRTETTHAFLYQTLRGLVSSAVRLSIVGPLEGQRIQAEFSPELDDIAAAAEKLTLDDLSQCSPLQDLFQATQDRLYSRLFQS